MNFKVPCSQGNCSLLALLLIKVAIGILRKKYLRHSSMSSCHKSKHTMNDNKENSMKNESLEEHQHGISCCHIKFHAATEIHNVILTYQM